MNILWTEKYRPKDSNTFQAYKHIKQFLSKPTNQHLLLYGPPGTGKTTFAHIISKETDIFELNASDERGISTVRNKIKVFASGINKKKTIILDECDNLTSDAQQCLRRIIEDYSDTTRFIFITNYLSKTIGPLKSRLFKIKFECLPKNYIYLKEIGDKEGLIMEEEFYKDLFVKCNKDLRRSLNILQGVAPFVEELNSIDNFIGIVPKTIIDNFLNLNNNTIRPFVDSFLRNGYGLIQFLNQLNKLKFDDKEKSLLSCVLSQAENKAIIGCSTELILLELCTKKIEIFKSK